MAKAARAAAVARAAGSGAAAGAKAVGPAARARAPRWTVTAERRFLDELAVSANVTRSAGAAGVSSAMVYHRRRACPAFGARWAEALMHGYHLLEARLLAVALGGVPGDEHAPGGDAGGDGDGDGDASAGRADVAITRPADARRTGRPATADDQRAAGPKRRGVVAGGAAAAGDRPAAAGRSAADAVKVGLTLLAHHRATVMAERTRRHGAAGMGAAPAASDAAGGGAGGDDAAVGPRATMLARIDALRERIAAERAAEEAAIAARMADAEARVADAAQSGMVFSPEGLARIAAAHADGLSEQAAIDARIAAGAQGWNGRGVSGGEASAPPEAVPSRFRIGVI